MLASDYAEGSFEHPTEFCDGPGHGTEKVPLSLTIGF